MRTVSDLQPLLDAAQTHSTPLRRTTVVLPPGDYYADVPLVISKRLRVLAHDVAIHVPKGGTGVVIGTSDRLAGLGHVVLEGIHIEGAKKRGFHGKDGTEGLAIFSSRATVRDVTVVDVATGVRIEGVTSKGTNANAWYLDRCCVWRAHVGVHVVGADANAGTSVALDINACFMTYLDESFLGNTSVGMCTHPYDLANATNVIEETSNSSYGVHIGTYIEGFRTLRTVSKNSLVVGGTGAQKQRGPGKRVGSGRTNVEFRGGDDNTSQPKVTLSKGPNIPLYVKWPDGLVTMVRMFNPGTDNQRLGVGKGTLSSANSQGLSWDPNA